MAADSTGPAAKRATLPTRRHRGRDSAREKMSQGEWTSRFRPGLEASDHSLHHLFMLLHASQQRELDPATIQILARPARSEVAIPFQEVGEEADPAFQGDDLRSRHEGGALRSSVRA